MGRQIKDETTTRTAATLLATDWLPGQEAAGSGFKVSAGDLVAGVTKVINVLNYGATITKATIQAALDDIEAVGYGALWIPPGSTVNLGSLASSENAFLRIDDVDGFAFLARGVTFTCAVTGTSGRVPVLRLHNCRRTYTAGYHVTDTAYDKTNANVSGAEALDISCDGSSADYGGHVVEDISGKDVATLLQIARSDTGNATISGIRARGLRGVNVGYGLATYRVGTAFDVRLDLEDCHRAVLINGSTNGRVRFGYRGVDGTLPIGLVLVYCETGYPDAAGIDIAGVVSGSITDSDLVLIQQVGNGGAGVQPTGSVTGVAVALDATAVTGYSNSRRVATVRAYDSTGAEVTGAMTTAVYDDLALAVRMPSSYTPANEPLLVRAWKSGAIKRMSVQGSSGWHTRKPLVTPGFAVHDSPHTFVRHLDGDLTTQTVDIPVTRGCQFAFVVEVFAENDWNASGPPFVHEQVRIVGSCDNTTGAVTIRYTDTEWHRFYTTDNTVGYAAGTDVVTVSFSAYNASTAHASVRVRNIRGVV